MNTTFNYSLPFLHANTVHGKLHLSVTSSHVKFIVKFRCFIVQGYSTLKFGSAWQYLSISC